MVMELASSLIAIGLDLFYSVSFISPMTLECCRHMDMLGA